jgi:signal transduction histidine kinase
MIPMTVLQGHLAALRDGSGAPDPEHLRGAMEEVQYITSLIQNLGASAKLETGERTIERGDVPLNALVERVVARHAPLARQKGLELDFAVPEEELVVQGDITLLEQAVGNLVQNAVRYVPTGGHVALLLDGETRGAWSLRVIDDGPGVDEELIDRLQQRSFRGDEARARYPEGQGLGLHIAMEVARRHGFELELRRSEHGGLEAILRGGAPAA